MADKLNIKVQRLHKIEGDGVLRGFADIIVNEAILIKGIRIVEGKKAKDNKWYESVRCLTKEVREQLSEAILHVYYHEKEQANNVKQQ